MIEMKHTPGPLSIMPTAMTRAQWAKLWHPELMFLVTGWDGLSGETVAIVYGDDDTQEKANALLFAAASDMLEALRLCIPENVCLTNPNVRDNEILPMDVTMGDLRKIAAAIAKATLTRATGDA